MNSAGRPNPSVRPRASRQNGYVLLALLLIMALLAIAAAVIVPSITFEIRRDREEELIQRGVQYSRAIRAYSKKTGRFPTRLEDLRDPNGIKYLRKIYKDPITGQDFKLLHMADISGLSTHPLNPSQPAGEAAATPTDAQPDPSVQSDDAGTSGTTTPGAAGGNAQAFALPNTSGIAGRAAVQSAPNGPSGLLIFGVASSSKDKTIREFDHKNHYNDWLFFYDPRYETGHLIKGPTSLTLPTNSLQQGVQGQGQNPAASQTPLPNQNPPASPQ